MTERKKIIVGVGSALVDILINENDDFLKRICAAKGGMTLVDYKVIENALSLTDAKQCLIPGGSACNTIIGIARLGGKAIFVGKRGEDNLGELFENDLKRNCVEPKLFKSNSPTGCVLSIITPDAERTMLTFLGASSETEPHEISQGCFEDAYIVHLEGYLAFKKDFLLMALESAKLAGAKISFDLSSFTIVEAYRDLLEDVVDKYVDILIANEDEARAFTGYTDELKAIEALSKKADIAVLKVGERGSYIASKGKEYVKINPKCKCVARDTTGAGDLWAAGFLFGLSKGMPIEKCGEIGSACGYEVCQVIGSKIPDDGWKRIKF